MADMTPEERKTLACHFLDELYNNGNRAVVYERLLPDFVYTTPTPPITPDREGVIQEMEMLRAAFPDLTITIDDLFVEGDRLAVRWTMRGTQDGAIYGVPPTHRQVTWSGIAIARMADGKVAEWWNYPDTVALFAQIGALPELAAMAPQFEGEAHV